MSAGDDLLLAGRTVAGLAVVLVVVVLAARIARRAGGGRAAGGMRVVERIALSRDASLALVEAGGRALLIGVTAQRVCVLATLGTPDGPVDGEAAGETATTLPELPGELPEVLPDEIADRVLKLPRVPPPRLERPGRHAAPAAGPEPPGAGRVTSRPAPPGRDRAAAELLAGLDLDSYPDLATALRAAGRTTGTRNAGAAATGAGPGSAPGSAPGSGPPRQAATATRAPAPVPRPRQASGSVLSPGTWRQGLDALRDRTARRG